MKVGDLVMLSAAGKKLKRCAWVQEGDIGLVKSVLHSWHTQYRVAWLKSSIKGLRGAARGPEWIYYQLSFDRKDLKFASRGKK